MRQKPLDIKFFTASQGHDPFNQYFRKFRSKTQWVCSVQPEKFRKTGPPFEVVLVSRSDRLEFWLNRSRPSFVDKKMYPKCRFCEFTTDEIQKIIDKAVPEATKKATKFVMRLFNGTYLLSFP